MSEITEKVLRSGLIDKHTAELMEQYGLLDPGAAEKVNEEALTHATKQQMAKLAEALAEAVEREHTLRETYLDLDKIRWPAMISILRGSKVTKETEQVVGDLHAVIDRHGRYFFRRQDVDPGWFVPGFLLERHGTRGLERIVEATELFSGEQPVCIQVSTVPEK